MYCFNVYHPVTKKESVIQNQFCNTKQKHDRNDEINKDFIIATINMFKDVKECNIKKKRTRNI